MEVSHLFESFKRFNVEFYTGVPDSLLKNFCAYITDNVKSKDHIIAANEGAAIGLATGYHLATGKIPLVYLQNSGLGNTINPLLSLADKNVYSVPMVLMIGWRGEPGSNDEPQHMTQGRVQNDLLKALNMPYYILDENTGNVESFVKELVYKAKSSSAPVAVVVKAGAFAPYELMNNNDNNFEITREQAISSIVDCSKGDEIFVSTTGKASRELFEIRVSNKQDHQNDFLTVGSMGHSSQIALGIALNTDRPVICLDGDGATIMHMGSMAIIGNSSADNYFHIVLNNGSHDSVGGQPTVGLNIDLVKIALSCGYRQAVSVDKESDIKPAFEKLKTINGPVFMEIKVKTGARSNLGRPTKTPVENKNSLMKTLNVD